MNTALYEQKLAPKFKRNKDRSPEMSCCLSPQFESVVNLLQPVLSPSSHISAVFSEDKRIINNQSFLSHDSGEYQSN